MGLDDLSPLAAMDANAIQALVQRDSELAATIVQGDQKVDDLERGSTRIDVAKQVVAAFGGEANTSPAGSVSLTAMPFSVCAVFGLARVSVSTEAAPTARALGANDLAIAGAPSTIVVAVGGDGTLFTMWYDWRDAIESCGGRSHVYLAHSDDGGASFARVSPLNPRPCANSPPAPGMPRAGGSPGWSRPRCARRRRRCPATPTVGRSTKGAPWR